MNVTNNERLTYNVTDAAQVLGCSRDYMYKLMRREDFDCVVQLGKRKLISRAKLAAWVDRQTVKE